MKAKLTLIAIGLLLGLFLLAGSCLAQAQVVSTKGILPKVTVAGSTVIGSSPAKAKAVPIQNILPEDIVQDSANLVRFSTNGFAVRFTYTEAGAKKMLAFRNAHDGQEVITRVGSYESRGTIWPRDSYPPGWKNDEGWLKRRTDKFFCVSEDDAKKILAGLKGK